MREFLNKNKWTLIITSMIILLPIAAGLILWNHLPEQMPIHWGVNGEVDGWASKPVAVFLLPAVMLAVQWLCVVVTTLDPKGKNAASGKMMGLVLWIIPMLNLFLHVMVYLAAFDRGVNAAVVLPLIFGMMFVAIGNYLPKCRQSYTMGIKLPWTLNDEENWNATHRVAGRLWVAGGLLCMPCALLPATAAFIAMMVVLAVMCAVPTMYSYRFYKKNQHKEDD